MRVFLAIGLPLFIKPRQIQLARGLPPNLINLLSCEKLNSPANISFLQQLIRSVRDIQWGFLSLRLHHSHWHLNRGSRILFSSHLLHEMGWRVRGLCSLLEQTPIRPSRRLTGRADFPYRGWPTKARARPGLLAFLGEMRQAYFCHADRLSLSLRLANE